LDLDRKPSQIASALAEEARALNHRTLDADAFSYPSDVSDTANGVAATVQRLPQALQQLEAGLKALDASNRIRLADRHPSEVSRADIVRAVSTALFGLQEARQALGSVEEHLRTTTGVLGNLGAPWDDDEGDSAE
jgi:hypothetical protein